jgi:hypothetical protein
MDGLNETRKEWAAPELKKIDIDEITAHGHGSSTDNLNTKS